MRSFRLICILHIACLSLYFQGCASTFVVTSDIQQWPKDANQSSQYFEGACKAIKQIKPGDFMISTGDIVPPDRIYDEIKTAFGPDYTWYPVIGNHNIDRPEDMQWIRNYVKENLRNINPGPESSEETTYSFDYKNAHIIVLNEYYDGTSDTGTRGDICDSLYKWIENDLASNKKPFIFVFGHEPFVVIADIDNGRVRHRGDSLDLNPENSHRTLTLFRKYKVTAYICGHTHNFSYAKINDIWHINIANTMGAGDKKGISTFLKVNIGLYNCWIDAYRFDRETNLYQKKYTFDLK